jgi:hypothetical protein
VANKAARISLGLTAFYGALSVGRPISWALDTLLPSGHDELRDADQIIGDDVDEEIASHAMERRDVWSCAWFRAACPNRRAYDTADHIAALRVANVTPHVAQNECVTKAGKQRKSAIDGRTTRHEGYAMSQTRRKMIELGPDLLVTKNCA